MKWPNFYSTTAGSFIQTSLSTELESPDLFIINQTCLQYTSAGALIQSSLLARSINRDQFNKSPLDSVQMKFFVREILDATPRSRVTSQGGSRRETGRNDLDAPNGDPLRLGRRSELRCPGREMRRRRADGHRGNDEQ